MDALSAALKTVRLEGAMFYNAEFTAPWNVRSPAACEIAPHLAAGHQHIILFHLLTRGRAHASVERGEVRLSLEAGDIVVFPHGDAHFVGNGRETVPRDHGKMIEQVLAQGLRPARMGGGGEATHFVCGYLQCDAQISRACLGGLPPMFKVHLGDAGANEWIGTLIRSAVERAAADKTGSEVVVAKLSEALFAETLRRYVEQLPEGQTGWLAGARDAEVGSALTLLHRRPTEPWTVASLARAVGVSRSVLAENFRHFLDEPPIAYLARWRLQMGAQLLVASRQSVARIAGDVGYDSEQAFNRAFKRAYGMPPARFRARRLPME